MPYWSRPDLGIDRSDVVLEGRTMRVTVHSLGAVDAPPMSIVVRNADGKEIGRGKSPVLPAPNDLMPKTAVVTLKLTEAARAGSVTIEGAGTLPEITTRNNFVKF